ncbi:MAG TPA: hypothetical protein VJN67_13260 [Stellaceae bacterium]|nr:hypothetical protein [Stellaceae bacterium]
MAGPNPNRDVTGVRGAGFPGRRIASRADFWRGARDTMATFMFCTGVMLVPALAALDLAVGLACQNVNGAACIALFQPATD